MKKCCIILLVLILLSSSSIVFSAEGDIIHTGWKKFYSMSDESDIEELVSDIEKGAAIDKFYREVLLGDQIKYINLEREENKQLEVLKSLIAEEGIVDNDGLIAFIEENEEDLNQKFEDIISGSAIVFNDIPDSNKGNLEDYEGVVVEPPEEAIKDNGIEVSLSKGVDPGHSKLEITSPGSGNWKIGPLLEEPSIVYVNSVFQGSVDYGEALEIQVASIDQVEGMDADFSKLYIVYNVLDGKISTYNFFSIGKDDIGQLAEAPLLVEEDLTGEDMAEEDMPKLSKGLKTGYTKILNLDNIAIEGASRWMYALVEDVNPPKKDRLFPGSIPYGNNADLADIKVELGDKLMILASDDGGKVKAYGIFTLDESMIKGELAHKLVYETNFSNPKRGTSPGSIQFEFLQSNKGNLYYELSDSPIDIPEKDGDFNLLEDWKITPSESGSVDNIKIFQENAEELKDENGFLKYMMIYAVDGGKIKASLHENFILDQNNVRLPKADDLPEANYGASDLPLVNPLEKGTSPNTTVLKVLNKNAIPGADALTYRYKFVGGNPEIGINEIVPSLKNDSLKAGKELGPANIGEYLLVLLVDSQNRTKYYAYIGLNDNNTRFNNAPPLRDGFHYTNPVPGTAFSSSRFNLLNYSDIEGASQYMVAVSNNIEAFKNIEFNSVVAGAVKYASIATDGAIEYKASTESGITKIDGSGNILNLDVVENSNRYLVLLGTDSQGKVKAYKSFTLRADMVRGQEALTLKENTNYIISKGSKPGTIKFSKLSPFGIGNRAWMYKWSETDVFTGNPPFTNQIISGPDAFVIDTRFVSESVYEAVKDIKIEKQIIPPEGGFGDPTYNYGYLLLLATNGNRVVAYDIIDIKSDHVQDVAPALKIDLTQGDNADSTKIVGDEKGKANKYIFYPSPMDSPAPGEALPQYGVKDFPATPGTKEIQVSTGDHLRVFQAASGKIIAFKDFIISKDHIKQGKASLSIFDESNEENIYQVLEGKVKANSLRIKIKLENATWADVRNDNAIKSLFLDGFKASGNEASQWAKVIENTKNDRYSISKNTSGDAITVTTSATGDFDISELQEISLTIPARAIVGARNPVTVHGKIVIKPTIDAKVSGSILDNVRQSKINSGTASIVIDIVDSSWIDNIETNDNKNLLLKGFVGDKDSPEAEANSKWQDLKELFTGNLDNIKVKNSQQIEITIPENDIKIISPETITLTIDSSLVKDTEADAHIIGAPSFTLYPDILHVKGSILENKEVILEAPNFVNALKDEDFWEFELTDTSFKEDFLASRDLTISQLPSGLNLDISKESDKKLKIKLTGRARNKLENDFINITIKASAINEINYRDSLPIRLNYVQGLPMSLDGITYELKDDGIYIHIHIDDTSIDTGKLEYSLDSRDGINGVWLEFDENISDGSKAVSTLKPLKLYVRETDQKANVKLLGDLTSPLAPTDVAIENYDYDYSGDGEFVITLNQNEDDLKKLQYKLSPNGEWKNFDLTNPDPSELVLAETSALFVRNKVVTGIGENSSLPSLPSGKLNGLYLGKVKLDVSQSKILGGSKDMKYKLSGDGTWNSIATNDPLVDFKEGNEVWISEAKNETNQRRLGLIQQSKFEVDQLDKVNNILESNSDPEEGQDYEKGFYYHIGQGEVLNRTMIRLQYNITKGQVPVGNWYDLEENVSLSNVSFIPGNLFVRKVDDENYLPSNPNRIVEIKEAIDPPNMLVVEDGKIIKYEGEDNKYKELDAHFEYKINNGDYQNGDLLKNDPQRMGNVTIYVKKKATRTLLPSKEVSFKFTENISLANVRVNAAEGTIENTSVKMEYRTDKNNPWTRASANKTPIAMYQGMNLWVREVDKASTEKEILIGLAKMDDPPKEDLDYSVSAKWIKNVSDNILEYRINYDVWRAIAVGETISIDFVPVKLSIRTKATRDKLPSSDVNVIDNLAYPDVEPQVVFDDGNNKITAIDGFTKGWSIYEFKSKGDAQWISGLVLRTYDFSGNKIIQIRKVGTKDKLPSEIREIVFTKNISLDKVRFRNVEPLKLLYTEAEMEYQVYLNDGLIPNKWTKASPATSDLDKQLSLDDIKLIVVRDSRNIGDFIVLKAANGEFGDQSDLPIDFEDSDNKIDYEISVSSTSSSIIFTGITNKMEYKISSAENWTLGDGNPVNAGIPDIMEMTIRDKNYPTNTKTISISERAEIPEVSVSKVDYLDSSMELTLTGFEFKDIEYSYDNGDWKPASGYVFPITKDGILKVRAKAIGSSEDEDDGKGKLPSLPTNNLNVTSLVDVRVNMDNPSKTMLVATSKFMEYSLDSTDGKKGSWTNAKDLETPLVLTLGKELWIREIRNTANAKKIGPIGQEPVAEIINNVNIFYNISKRKIANFTKQNLEYRMAGGSWKPINESLDEGVQMAALNVEFEAGPLEFRRAARGSNFPSKPISLVVITSASSAPVVVFDDIEDKIISIDGISIDGIGDLNLKNYEYKVISEGSTSEWAGAVFGAGAGDLLGQIFSGNQEIKIRKMASAHDLPSQEKTINFTDNMIKRVRLSTNVQPHELNGTTTQMQYRISEDGGEWRNCINGNTPLNKNNGDPLNDLTGIEKIEIRLNTESQKQNIFKISL